MNLLSSRQSSIHVSSFLCVLAAASFCCGCAEPTGALDEESTESAPSALTSPVLLGATFGAADINGLFGCAGTVVDGLPVVFSLPLSAATVSPADFRVMRGNTTLATPLCATFAPAVNADELRTILLQGDFGDSSGDDPLSVQVVGNILSQDGTANFAGLQTSVVPYAVGQYIVYARRQDLTGNVGGNDQCPGIGAGGVSTRQIVQVAFGSNAGNNFPATQSYRSRFHVMLQDGTEVSPTAFGDTTVDNYLELCVGATSPAVSVRIDPLTVQDASGQQNGVEISAPLEN